MKMLLRILVLIASAGMASAGDRYEGYYHPPISSEESFSSTLIPDGAEKMDRARRIKFITTLTQAQLAQPNSPPYALFAKGAEADQMFIVGLDSEVFKTIYRARAVMAQMTAKIRGGSFFENRNVRQTATFFDLLLALGFKSLVITDGEIWAHRVNLSQQGQDQQ